MKLKKILSIGMIGIMILSGCSNKEESETVKEETGNETKVYKIGISQLSEHPALDQVREGFVEGLEEAGINVEIDYKNAQGDTVTATSIASKFATDKVDMMLAIGTISAQTAKQTIGEIPLLFSAVTDPVGAGLVASWENPGGTVTGTSDEMPIKEQLAMLKEIDASITKVGIIYNPSEANSVVQVEGAQNVAEELGIEIVTVGVNNVNDVPQAIDSILSKVDALYTITDNTTASAMGTISEKAIEQKKIVVASSDTFVDEGNLITLGLSYKELGKQTAQMAVEIIQSGKSPSEIPVEGLREKIKVVNKTTMKALGLDENLPIFQGAKIVE